MGDRRDTAPLPQRTPAVVADDQARRRKRRPIQRKLIVGAAGDHYEREADDVARQVTALLHSPHEHDQAQRVAAVPSSRISRLATVDDAGGDVDPATEREIDRARGGGQPLDPTVRRQMEGAFGADFSGVRMHVGPQSDALNERVQARAFTTGSDIFVRRSDFNPRSTSGQALLAHELTHTIQQGGASVQRCVQRVARTGVIQRDWLSTQDRRNARRGKRRDNPADRRHP